MLSVLGCDSITLNPFEVPTQEVATKPIDPVENAQNSLDYFLDQYRKNRGQRFLIRAGFLGHGGNRVPLWVGKISVRNGKFTATIIDSPPKGFFLKKGATVAFGRSQIFDWIIVRDGVTYGGFTEKPKFQSFAFLKFNAEPLIQKRSPLGAGPSGNTWPRWPSHFEHRTSTRTIP